MSNSKTLPYYNYNNLLSRNGTFNFVVGGRGLGKTYGAKAWAIRDYIKNGNEFIYLRRYKTEQAGKDTFFTDIAHIFPEWDFRVVGTTAQIKRFDDESKGAWKVFGYFTQLSNAMTQKSIAYPKVTKIIYDEFIIQKGFVRYLPEEVKAFQEFYSTVDRWKDKTRVLFLANAVSIYNPYFLEWGIEPDGKSEWYSRGDGFIVAHFPNGDSFASAVFETRFGSFIKDTEYAEYSTGSRFHDANSLLIQPKTSTATYFCRFETIAGKFNVWVDYTGEGPIFYVNGKHPDVNDTLFTTLTSSLAPNCVRVDKSTPVVSQLVRAYKRAQVYFSTARMRSAFEELLKSW